MTWAAIGVTVEYVAVAASVAGAATSAVAQRNAATAANDTAQYNANQARQQAGQEDDVATENARRSQNSADRILAQQQASLAAGGLSLEGSPLAVLGQTATTLQRDILDIGFDAQNKENALLSGANLSVFEGEQQANALDTQSWATIIGGLGSASSGYIKSQGLIGGTGSAIKSSSSDIASGSISERPSTFLG